MPQWIVLHGHSIEQKYRGHKERKSYYGLREPCERPRTESLTTVVARKKPQSTALITAPTKDHQLLGESPKKSGSAVFAAKTAAV